MGLTYVFTTKQQHWRNAQFNNSEKINNPATVEEKWM
jgi:hypothetical protein